MNIVMRKGKAVGMRILMMGLMIGAMTMCGVQPVMAVSEAQETVIKERCECIWVGFMMRFWRTLLRR